MSGIVIELQRDALSSDSDIISLLRKAYLIARKLDLKDFESWTSYELNGYPNTSSIPDYRTVRGELKAWNPYYGWIPVVLQSADIERSITEHKLDDSLSNLLNLYEGDSSHFVLSFNGEINTFLSKCCDFDTKYCVQVGKNLLYKIAEIVKNHILDWAITLEENGILGENLSFSNEEKGKAQIPIIYNYTNNFYKDASNIQIQQDTTDSLQG
ncbi:MAG: hypothetical protein ACLUN9_28250 [Enterocloster aldenensis]|uniref:AbiTii domain-containing protein n=1 Tax=Enterocloster aldenensis TaxID=358742 RepID=UPI000ECFE56B|nr:hypothetical protein DW690_27505 [Dorea longicatena]